MGDKGCLFLLVCRCKSIQKSSFKLAEHELGGKFFNPSKCFIL